MELEELKKSWNALDEHLKDKEFIKEEELEKLMVHILHNTEAGLIALFCFQCLPIQSNRSVHFFQKPAQAACHRRFSRAVMTDNPQHFASFCRKAKAAEYRLLIKGTGKVFYG